MAYTKIPHPGPRDSLGWSQIQKLSPNSLYLYGVLVEYRFKYLPTTSKGIKGTSLEGTYFQRLEDIAEATGLSLSTVQRSISELRAAGLLYEYVGSNNGTVKVSWFYPIPFGISESEDDAVEKVFRHSGTHIDVWRNIDKSRGRHAYVRFPKVEKDGKILLANMSPSARKLFICLVLLNDVFPVGVLKDGFCRRQFGKGLTDQKTFLKAVKELHEFFLLDTPKKLVGKDKTVSRDYKPFLTYLWEAEQEEFASEAYRDF